jgi:hypothetical protein
LSQNAAKDAKKRFDLERQVNNYLDWYKELFIPSRNKVLVTGAGFIGHHLVSYLRSHSNWIRGC